MLSVHGGGLFRLEPVGLLHLQYSSTSPALLSLTTCAAVGSHWSSAAKRLDPTETWCELQLPDGFRGGLDFWNLPAACFTPSAAGSLKFDWWRVALQLLVSVQPAGMHRNRLCGRIWPVFSMMYSAGPTCYVICWRVLDAPGWTCWQSSDTAVCLFFAGRKDKVLNREEKNKDQFLVFFVECLCVRAYNLQLLKITELYDLS